LIDDRKREGKSERTIASDYERAKVTKRLIGSQYVNRVTAYTILEYQNTRKAEGVSGRTINMEITLVRLVLKKAKRWGRIADGVKNMKEDRDSIGRTLTQEEKLRLFQVAASVEQWYRALYCGVIAVNTTGRKIEVLRSRVRDVDFSARVWNIPTSKTSAGVRQIALNDEALHAFVAMKRVLEDLGGGEPDHYFFPACECLRFDFTRHQKTVRTAWRKLTAVANLKGFRIHDLRHQCLTEMAEADFAPDVMMSIAGHLSEKMRRHYVHVRDQAKQKAVAALPGTGLFRNEARTSEPRKREEVNGLATPPCVTNEQ
jgi:integrase